jgi:hypothetical protein
LKPGPTRGWNRAGLKKKQGKEKPGVTQLTWQVDPARPGCKPINFCFCFSLFYY